MSRLKNALPEDIEEGDYDLVYNPADGMLAVSPPRGIENPTHTIHGWPVRVEEVTYPQTSTTRLLDAVEVEKAHKEYTLSRYTSQELQDELTRRDK